jgi:ribosomal RNA-processing protein 1
MLQAHLSNNSHQAVRRPSHEKTHPLKNSLDRHIRDASLEKLRTYLRNRKSLDLLEAMKLWKGLFYCMWMSDRARTQQQLARSLASLVEDVPASETVIFLDAFWKTMAREWIGIDALR